MFVVVVLTVIGTILSTIVTHGGPGPAIIVVLVAVVAIISLGRGLRRNAATLDSLVDATRRVEDGDYSVRVDVPEGGFRPVRQLVRGFDTMVERLEVDEQQRRSLLADVSHELRTPLTVISGNLEAMIDGVHPIDEARLGAILDETRVMERLIDDLRTVALSEAGTLTLHREPTDPDVLIAEVVRSFEGAAGTAGVTVTAEVGDDLPILDVDPVRLREVLANLVANAIRHTPAGGTVVIRGEVAGDRLVLQGRGFGLGHRPGRAPARLRSIREGRGFGRFGIGPRDRAPPRGRARRHARGRGHGERRHHVPCQPAADLRLSRRPYSGRVIRTSSTAASTVEAVPRSCARNTIRTVCPAHGVIGIVARVHAGVSLFAAPRSSRTSVRVPSAASTYARNTSADDEFEAWAR